MDVRYSKAVLSGKISQLKIVLEKEMTKLSNSQQFENAILFRERIKAMEEEIPETCDSK